MPTTIRDVAKQAGVGLGTVSRVLNNSPKVSDATRQRVLEVIEDLDYHPSPVARRLSLGKTQTIGAAIPYFTSPSAVVRLRGIANTLADSEYDLIVIDVETPERHEAYFSKLARGGQVDGLLILSLAPPIEVLERIRATETPLVLIDVNDPALVGFHRILADDVGGGKLATEYLIQLGHRRIGHIGDVLNGTEYFTSSKHRYEGYRRALERAGIPVAPDLHKQGPHGRSTAERLATELFNLSDPPTAIFAASDTQAAGVIEAARSADIRIPQDLSVIGYDDIELAEHLGLTTIRQLLYESGKRGANILFKLLEDPDFEIVSEVLPTELVVRETTAPPAAWQG